MRASQEVKSQKSKVKSQNSELETLNSKLAEIHISGAEGLYEVSEIQKVVKKYIERARKHSKGMPDKITVTIEEIKQRPRVISSLPVATAHSKRPAESKKIAIKLLQSFGVSKTAMDKAFELIRYGNIRGAVLITAEKGDRLEPDKERGIRVSRLGIDQAAFKVISAKLSRHGLNTDTVKEALILASKVASCKNVVAELCVSDDPFYTTGYIASKKFGYRGMHLTLVHTTSCVLLKLSSSMYLLSRNRLNEHCLLKQSIKKFSTKTGCPSIKTKRKFIQVIIQMGRLSTSLMSTKQPLFEQPGNLTCQRKQIISDIGALSYYVVLVTFRRQVFISFPSISTHSAVWLYTFLYCWYETIFRSIGNTVKTNSSKTFTLIFYRNQNQGFTGGTTTPFPWFRTSNVCFIHLHKTRQFITTRTNHRKSQFMKPCPNSSIIGKAENSLKPQCTDSVLLIDYIPDCSKPQHQWFSCILKDGSCCNRNLIITLTTSIKATIHPPRFMMVATRTIETIWPTQPCKIFVASFFSSESFFKFKNCPGVIFHYPIFYILWLRESSAYPYKI